MSETASYRERMAPVAPAKRSAARKQHGAYYAAGLYVRRYGDHGTICTATSADWARQIARAMNLNLARALRVSLGRDPDG